MSARRWLASSAALVVAVFAVPALHAQDLPEGSDAETSDRNRDGADGSGDGESRQTADDEDDGESSGRSFAVEGGFEPSIVIEPDTDSPRPNWWLGIGGFIRPQFTHIQDDPNVDDIGRNDGFILDSARLTLVGALANGLGFQFQFDGSVAEPQSLRSPTTPVNVRLRSTFVFYQPFEMLRVSTGQFKPPYDVEEQVSNAELMFVESSVVNRGVRNVEGFNVEGLAQDREVGLRVHGGTYYPLADGDEKTGPGFSGAVAVTNGQEINRNLNDNDRLAYYGRGNLHWGEYLKLGGAYYYNDETRGERPNLVDVETTGWTADLTASAHGVTVIASVLSRTEEPFQNAESPEGELEEMGYQAQIGYEEPFFGFQPAYRFAYLDPSSDFSGDTSGSDPIRHTRTYHTVGLNWNSQSYPVRVMLNYTFTDEGAPVNLDNDRFDALVQLTW